MKVKINCEFSIVKVKKRPSADKGSLKRHIVKHVSKTSGARLNNLHTLFMSELIEILCY